MPGKWAPTASAMQSTKVAGISDLALAASTVLESSTQRGRRGDEEPVEPALLDVAGEVDAGRGAGEAGGLQHADRDQEARVALGREAAQVGQAAEDAVDAEEEDRRRQHAGDHRPGNPQQLVPGPRHQGADHGEVGAPGRDRDRGLHQPTLSLWRRARALSRRLDQADAEDREHRFERLGGRDAGDDRVADPFDDEAERVVLGDRLRRLDHQLQREVGGGEEEDDEDEREDPLDDARVAGAQGDRGADPAHGERRRRWRGRPRPGAPGRRRRFRPRRPGRR